MNSDISNNDIPEANTPEQMPVVQAPNLAEMKPVVDNRSCCKKNTTGLAIFRWRSKKRKWWKCNSRIPAKDII